MKADDDGRYDQVETREVLATALVLAHRNPELNGMSPELWVEDAEDFRARVKAAGDIFYVSLEELP